MPKKAAAPKKYVFVLVHGDMWGAYNANMLVQAVKQNGAEPILIVSRSTPGKDGKPLTKVSELVPSRVLKEETMLNYFHLIDESERLADRHKGKRKVARQEPDFLTFKQLAQRYCADGEVHFTTSGGKKGGEDILKIFEALKAKHITPEVVLSGDTLAILPEAITANYDCFGTHPGPLPFIKGMQGTERSLVNRMFYDHEGNYMPPGSYLPGGGTHVKGCFFHLAPVLDEGVVIDEGLTPVMPGMDLLQVRTDLYWALVDKMINHMPELLDKNARQAMLAHAKANQRLHNPAEEAQVIADLTSEQLIDWHSDGTAYVTPGERLSDQLWTPHDTPDQVEILQNLIVDPDYFKSRMADFFPGAHQARGESGFTPAFEGAFEPLFRRELDAIVAQADHTKGFDIREMERIQREVNDGTFDDDHMSAEEAAMNLLINKANHTVGKQYAVRVRHQWSDGSVHKEREPQPGGRKR